MEKFWQDIRYAARTLGKARGFAGIAVLTLALGIGANTAIFCAVNAVLLRPLPYTHGEQLVRVAQAQAQAPAELTGGSYLDYTEWREQNSAFSEMAGLQAHDLILTGHGEPIEAPAVVVTPEMFAVLGTQPLAGRAMVAADGERGAAPVVMVSENLWRDRLGADPGAIGGTINLDQRAYTVIGVMPASFRVPLAGPKQDVWIPLAQDPPFGGWMARNGGHWLPVIARLKNSQEGQISR